MRWPQPHLIGGRSPGRWVSAPLSAFRLTQIAGERFAPFAVWRTTASVPDAFAPHAWTPPIMAGAMSVAPSMALVASANALSGGPMQAAASMAMAVAQPSLSLTVSMSAPWTGAYTPTANLRMTVGMTATYAAAFTGVSNLAMIIPLGTTSFAAAFTGSANLKGKLEMSASFGGSEPLSPEGLARAMWEALAAGYDTPGTMGAKLNAAGAASNPWTTPEGQSVVNNTGLIPALI